MRTSERHPVFLDKKVPLFQLSVMVNLDRIGRDKLGMETLGRLNSGR
ncbi:MAG: hypothetical protein HOJ21_13195 [Alphaproteobacteria bacterium]|nr:hypothetical protein [Alphaproteobacteria bacterium]